MTCWLSGERSLPFVLLVSFLLGYHYESDVGESTDRYQSCVTLGRISSVLWLLTDDCTGGKMEEKLTTAGTETGKTLVLHQHI